MQLEMLNPKTRSSFHNGIVTKIIDKYYFIVSLADRKGEFDQLIDNDNSWLCTIDHPYIFPVGKHKNLFYFLEVIVNNILHINY